MFMVTNRGQEEEQAMRRSVLAALVMAAATGCGAEELSTEQACAEVREPVEDAIAEGDVAGAAEVLHDVADRGDTDVRRIFGDAAEAADYIAENGNIQGAPQWATMAFGQLDATCGEGSGD
jgi:hypothetical protein